MKALTSLVADNLHKVDLVWATEVDISGLPSDADILFWADSVMTSEARKASEVSIRVVGTAEIRQLNAQYRNKDKATNVLSFPLDVMSEESRCLLGDLIICADVVLCEAEAQGKSISAHFAHMVIHGILHLLGYDHIEDNQAEEMEQIEVELLRTLEFPNPYLDKTPKAGLEMRNEKDKK